MYFQTVFLDECFFQICIQQHSSTILLVAVDFQFILLGFLSRHNDNSVSSLPHILSHAVMPWLGFCKDAE